ncbi:MAG TPA: maleylpyruvate isomerase N-terminal domain-containing protein [Acidimicrobiales bacterium]|nr:maleylpyruvate isomerase N-terminal domain-containing protein [Acidimicrobiales bacterium]
MPSETDVKSAFHDASNNFVAVVDSIGPERLGEPATDEWTILELIAHTARAYIAIEEVLARPLDPASRQLSDAAAYYRSAMSIQGVHDGITKRARDGASLMGNEPGPYVHDVADRVHLVVSGTPTRQDVQHYAGRIAFGDYLVTRITELVLHSVDLQHALGRTASAPDNAAVLVRDVLVALADRDDALSVACALSGRSRARACNVLC